MTLVQGKNADLYRVRMVRSDKTHEFEEFLATDFSAAMKIAHRLRKGRAILTYARWGWSGWTGEF